MTVASARHSVRRGWRIGRTTAWLGGVGDEVSAYPCNHSALKVGQLLSTVVVIRCGCPLNLGCQGIDFKLVHNLTSLHCNRAQRLA
jgi:hypothetical protein